MSRRSRVKPPGTIHFDRKGFWLSALLTIGVGWVFLWPGLGDGLAHLGYDSIFPLRPARPVDEVVLVYLDDASSRRLNQPANDRWNRRLHADLLQRLTTNHARAAIFDITFSGTTTNDPILWHAIDAARAAGTEVVLAGEIVSEQVMGQTAGHRVLAPFQTEADEQTLPDVVQRIPWGVPQAGRPDTAARRLYRDSIGIPTLAERALALATRSNAPAAASAQSPRDLWFNFYGPPGTLASVSFYRALENEALPAETFMGKVVFIGAQAGIGHTGGVRTDDFPSPYIGRGGDRFTGVELNATAYLNLQRGDGLRLASPWLQILVVAGCGLLLTVFVQCRLHVSLVLAGLLALSLIGGSLASAWIGHTWFPWGAIALVQIPVGFGWMFYRRARSLVAENKALAGPRPAIGSGQTVLVPEAAAPSLDDRAPAGTWPPRIPDHVLLKRVGSGAYGEVWLARTAVGTYQTVKIIRRNGFDSDGPFEREFRALQKFMPISRSHSGLVDILHVGRNDEAGIIYYTMEAADDVVRGLSFVSESYAPASLATWLKQKKAQGPEACRSLGVPLAQALDHLHARHLLHRDIKPDNIIFVGGKPKLADIGLVTDIQSQVGASLVGTPGYIPPEGPGFPAADIFALGMVLYQVLTGLDRDQFPNLPDDVIDRADADQFLACNEIIMKACALHPGDRFPTGAELARALEALPAPAQSGGS